MDFNPRESCSSFSTTPQTCSEVALRFAPRPGPPSDARGAVARGFGGSGRFAQFSLPTPASPETGAGGCVVAFVGFSDVAVGIDCNPKIAVRIKARPRDLNRPHIHRTAGWNRWRWHRDGAPRNEIDPRGGGRSVCRALIPDGDDEFATVRPRLNPSAEGNFRLRIWHRHEIGQSSVCSGHAAR